MNVVFQNSIIRNNTAINNGGGIYMENTIDVYLNNTVVKDNFAQG